MTKTDRPWTEGPWINDKGRIKQPDSFDWVGSVQQSNMPNWEANAHLIAQAPALYEALEAIVKESNERGIEELFDTARATLAAANPGRGGDGDGS